MAALTLDGVPASLLARRWGVPHCHLVERVTSTLDVVHALGERDAVEGTVVVAHEQTAGRGRDGRTWHSPSGGVWLGLLLRPAQAAPGTVAIRTGLVIADVVDELVGAARARLKWPNDVLLDDRKVAGVLCEGRWQGDRLQWLAVGLGINVCNEIPPAVRAGAIALGAIVPGVRRLDVLDRLAPVLPRLAVSGGRLTDAECAAFAARDWLRDRALRRPVAGRAAGVRSDGALLVVTADASTAVREGHVELA